MDFDNPPADPVAQMRSWLDEAGTTDLRNPLAATLATVDPDGRPSARIVLLKGFDDDGAVFFTNRESRKGRALATHPRATLLFHWDALARQATIEGPVSPVSDATSDDYFTRRPRGAQVGAWASHQSEPLGSRGELEDRVAELEERYAGGDVPRPLHWGGYRVGLDRIELWQGREDRLHDRLEYTRADDGTWSCRRLNP